MKKEYLYRYTTNNEGVWSAGKRLLPQDLIEEVLEAKKWLPKPKLPERNYQFYLTEKGMNKYKTTLLISHKKYLPNIIMNKIDRNKIKKVIYEDEWQVVEQSL